MGRLEQVVGGRLEEAVEERHAPKASDCGRSVRADALAQVWSCVVRHDPPRPEREGVDDLNSLAEESEFSAVNERCDIVGKDEAFADWVSCPEGTVGSFEPVPELSRARRMLYSDIKNVLLPEEEGRRAAGLTGAYMGFSPTQYALLVARMLRIGMCRLRRKVKVVNGVFGVWKVKPVKRKRRDAGAGAVPSPPTGDGSPSSPGSPPPGAYEVPGKVRLIVDMRKGNCFFVTPDAVELVCPTAIAQMHLDVDEVMVMSKADLDNYFYRCRIDEAYWPYFGLPAVRLGDLGLTKEELARSAPGMGEDELVHPVMCVLPMGWAHSPLIAQEAHEGLLSRASILQEKDRLRDSRPWGGRRKVHFSYIDDTVIIVIGKRRDVESLKKECNRLMRGALRVYRGAGIPAFL